MTVNYPGVAAALSHERLGPYLRHANNDPLQALMLYHRNLALSESLYPALQLVEVALRNRFEMYLLNTYGKAWYAATAFHALLEPRDLKTILNTQRDLTASNATLLRKNPAATPRPITSGRMIAELNFGFWTGLLGNHYSGRFWGRAAATLFPNEPIISAGKTLNDLQKAVNPMLRDVRHLRNRVFHHEPILHDGRLWDNHAATWRLLEWMSPEALDWARRVGLDRFPATYQLFHGPR